MRKSVVAGATFSWGPVKGRLRVRIDLECPDTPVLWRIGDDPEWKAAPFRSETFYRNENADASLAIRTVHDWLARV
jgi:hypothetical protein